MLCIMRSIRLSAALVLACGMMTGRVHAQEQSLPEIVLAPGAAAAQSVSVHSNGFSTAIAWVELDGHGHSVLKTTRIGDGLTNRRKLAAETRTLDGGGSAVISDPDVAVDPQTGSAAVAWIRKTPEGDALMLAVGGAPPELVASSIRPMEMPSLVYDAEGTPYLGWTEIDGGQSLVMAASREDGRWHQALLSSGDRPYDVLPQLFADDDSAEIYWYSIEDLNVTTRVAVLDGEGAAEPEATNLGFIPANRLPRLYKVAAPEPLLGALWVEQVSDGEATMDLDPRRAEGNGVERLGTPGRDPRHASVSTEGDGLKCWIEKRANGSRSLVVASAWGEVARRDVPESAGQAVVSATENWIHVAWIEEGNEAGRGSLYYWRTR